MAQKIERKDLQFSYFRLKDQKINEDPKGVMVMHIPSGNTVLAEDGAELLDNRKLAIARLYEKMGVPVDQWNQVNNCAACGHRLVPALEGWEIDYTYRYKLDGDNVSVALVVIESPEDDAWYWEATVTKDDGRVQEDHEGDLYETAEGASKAARAWAHDYIRNGGQASDGEKASD